MEELPLRGAARLREGVGLFWGSSRCAGLLDWGKKDDVPGGGSRCAGLLD